MTIPLVNSMINPLVNSVIGKEILKNTEASIGSILKSFTKFTAKHLCQSLNFFKKRLRHRCYSVNIVKYLRTLFLQATVSRNMKVYT